ncbi:MAG: type II toxin-antitoxin system prevent-host-death family antitoxin [Caldilineaceae bacterium]|nr:type II toxin-antitoxin system prevent-host-death family antitoxin [Caldilineaceae bacterium]HRJ43329.1 type II toxin-antitoxin system Phd/YefM family antitoxin [Caldilineaceae bacterium]
MELTLGITEARSRLGEIVDKARYLGETVVLLKSGKPAAAIVPYQLLEQWRREREALFAVVDEVQARNAGLEMDEDELMDFIVESVHESRAQA